MKDRILTGDRTTGRLHLGHYVGSLGKRVELQDKYETFILLADVQALTTHFEKPEMIRESIYGVAMDNIAVGLDPEKIMFIQQSLVPSIAELTVYYSMLVTVNALRHNPTVKTEAAQYGFGDMTYGFLGYPVSQAADITFCEARFVPVGEDQLPILEQCRKIASRFNNLYCGGEEVIAKPEPLLSSTPRLKGTDGNAKMGKSIGNAIYLYDDAQTVTEKIKSAVTDKNRISVSDKGNPDICAVFTYHQAFNGGEQENIADMCCNAKIGCVACKRALSSKINTLLDPVREKLAVYDNKRDYLRDIILSGSEKAEQIGRQTANKVRERMSLRI